MKKSDSRSNAGLSFCNGAVHEYVLFILTYNLVRLLKQHFNKNLFQNFSS